MPERSLTLEDMNPEKHGAMQSSHKNFKWQVLLSSAWENGLQNLPLPVTHCEMVIKLLSLSGGLVFVSRTVLNSLSALKSLVWNDSE